MGRSKFPGKPTKYVNRTRINVLSPVDESFSQPETSTQDADEQQTNQISYSHANEDTEVAALGALRRRRHWRKLKSTNLVTNSTNNKGFITRRAVKSRICITSGKRTYTIKTFKHRRIGVKESSGMVGNFVLPTRSIHSSRVIKPNKRFVNIDLSETTLRRKKVNVHEFLSENTRTRAKMTKTIQSGNVLRQARLKLHNQNVRSLAGPFSTNTESGSLPGTATCGVCGAVHFYRFIKQARKFNIYSCESCRKFISKMIKLQSCHQTSGLTIVCHKGQGMCDMLPITRMSRKHQNSTTYKSRCPACWLKMCLLSFQMPLQLKNKLIQLLPANMQSVDILFKTTATNLCNVDAKLPPNDNSSVQEHRNNSSPVQLATSSNVEKQKLDLKGPRVKHVCRSASIVLGHSPATFSPDPEEAKSVDSSSELEKEDASKCSETPVSSSEKSDSEPAFLQAPNERIFPCRRDRAQKLSTSFSSHFQRNHDKESDLEDTSSAILLDYWKKYDVTDAKENGFLVCSSQRFPVPAVCFLCGSAGHEELLFCTICCEPYHPFCLEQNPPVKGSTRSVWVCPTCCTCSVCKKAERQKIMCIKCSKIYHLECFTDQESITVNICVECLVCNDCGQAIPGLIGNIYLCSSCFLHRKKGCQCDICQRYFNEAEESEKIMGCVSCLKWVHAYCGGLSDDYYHILLNHPERAGFTCTTCSHHHPRWLQLVESELLRGCNRILRLLSSAALSTQSSRHSNEIYTNSSILDKSLESMPMIQENVNVRKYSSVTDFHADMKLIILNSNSTELLNLYHKLLRIVFPWFQQMEIADTGTMESVTQLVVAAEAGTIDLSEYGESRSCELCGSPGDACKTRLLYCGLNKWVHVNCAIWSSGVYELQNGFLYNVHNAIARGRSTRCSHCKLKGASISCCLKTCHDTYHFECAVTTKCRFLQDHRIYCGNHELSQELLPLLTDTNVNRKLFIAMDENKPYWAPIDKINVMVGSLHVSSLGEINSAVSDHAEVIVPTNYLCSRLYWSTVEPWKMVPYKISTSIYNSCPNAAGLSQNKSFTVDHSLPKCVADKKMREILLWHKKLDKSNYGVFDFEDESESQSSTEILSPEVTDAILNEFPHDLLNDISVQDIITKLMSYEDSVGTDCLYEMDVLNYMKVNRSPKISKPIVEYFMESDQNNDNRKVPKSCGFTIIGNSHYGSSPVKKKRKLEKRDSSLFLKVLQVDGVLDDSSSSDCDSSNECDTNSASDQPVTCVRCHSTYRTGASYKRHLTYCEPITSESDSEGSPEQESDIQDTFTSIKSNPYGTQTEPDCTEQFQNDIVSNITSENVTTEQQVTIVAESNQLCGNTTELLTKEVQNYQVYTVNSNIPQQNCVSQTGTMCLNQTIGYQRTATVIQPGVIINQSEMVPTILDMSNSMTTQPLLISPNVSYSIPDVTVGNPNYMYPILTQVPSAPCRTVLQMAPNNFMSVQSTNNQYLTLPMSQPYYQMETGYKMCSVLPEVQPTILPSATLESQIRVDNCVGLPYGLQLAPPVCYGVQTVVQNTVMQSQQLVPSVLPGLLTANRSCSTTTQIFQTSKIEPLLEVSGNLVVNPELLHPQLQTFEMNNIQTGPCETIKHEAILNYTVNTNSMVTSVPQSAAMSVTKPAVVPIKPTPTVKSNMSQTRPMNRVLPMQTMKKENKTVESVSKEKRCKPIESHPEKNVAEKVASSTNGQVVKTDLKVQSTSSISCDDAQLDKPQCVDLNVEKRPSQIAITKKIIQTFQKGSAKYPCFNIFNNKRSPIQVAPLKPIKSSCVTYAAPLCEKRNQLSVLRQKSSNANGVQKLRNERKENENVTAILYTIETHDGFKFSSTSVSDLWIKVFEAVQSARLAHNMPLLPSDSTNVMDNFTMLGLKKTGLRYLLEQLPGASKCTKYQRLFSFPKRFIETEPEDPVTGYNCARCEPNIKRHSPYDMFGWLASKHRRPEQNLLDPELLPRKGSINNLPMAMRFRQLKLTSKYSVGVYRSDIHRRGLFCLRDFEAGEMVIEYSGEVIRSVLTDKREKFYNTKGIGCYMFRIDDNLVVDATMTGNAARFINHSCDPNCYSKVVEILGHKHIIIFALRKIISGEELTYDYKFPIEEDKIPCTCGARRCRKFLN